MHPIKPIEQSADKWVRRASVAAPDYTAGIENPTEPWAQAAQKAEGNYKAGVTAAVAAGRFGKGVKEAGEERWRSNALRKGPGRYTEGVSIAKSDWQAGFAPYQSAIAALTLPDRGPRRDPKNLERVRAITTALGSLYEKRA